MSGGPSAAPSPKVVDRPRGGHVKDAPDYGRRVRCKGVPMSETGANGQTNGRTNGPVIMMTVTAQARARG